MNVKQLKWMTGFKDTNCGKIPIIFTELTSDDILGGWKARWGINRMDYIIEPERSINSEIFSTGKMHGLRNVCRSVSP